MRLNRVLRKYGAHNFITVLFSDENQELLAPTSQLALKMIMERIKHIFMTGLTITGRTYEFLGSSNSQLRRNGCWMYARDNNIEDTVQDIRHWMGDVANIRCVALYMARLGQFFSSSTEVVDLSNDGYTIEEIEDVKRNGYCFTEGAGRIAKDIANEVGFGNNRLKQICV